MTVADPAPVTAVSPYSRQMIAAWLIIPPMSVTTAPRRSNTGPQLGAVPRVTRISPSWTAARSAVSITTRAMPSARPGEAAMPVSSSLSSEPDSHAPTRSVVIPNSMIVNGSVMTAGGSFIAGVHCHRRPVQRLTLSHAPSEARLRSCDIDQDLDPAALI